MGALLLISNALSSSTTVMTVISVIANVLRTMSSTTPSSITVLIVGLIPLIVSVVPSMTIRLFESIVRVSPLSTKVLLSWLTISPSGSFKVQNASKVRYSIVPSFFSLVKSSSIMNVLVPRVSLIEPKRTVGGL